MPTLAELKKTYPTAKYEPNPNCDKCKGEGLWEHTFPDTESFGKGETKLVCCMCIFVAPEHLALARSVIKSAMSKIREDEDISEVTREQFDKLSNKD